MFGARREQIQQRRRFLKYLCFVGVLLLLLNIFGFFDWTTKELPSEKTTEILHLEPVWWRTRTTKSSYDNNVKQHRGTPYHIDVKNLNHQDWRKGLWNVEDIDSLGCTVDVLEGSPHIFEKDGPFKGCQAPLFSSLSEFGYIDAECPTTPYYSTDYRIGEEYQPLPITLDNPKPLVGSRFGQPRVQSDLVYINCGNDTNMHAQIVTKQESVKASKKILENYHLAPPNVVILVFDSTSKWAWFQKMLHTTKFLEEIGSKQGSDVAVFDFFRMNVLGEHTVENIPQLTAGCPPSPFRRKTTLCENVTELSHHLHQMGYVTGRAVSHEVRVNHYSYTKEPNVDRFYDHSFQVQFCQYLNIPTCLAGRKPDGPIAHMRTLNGEPNQTYYFPTHDDLKFHCLYGDFPERLFFKQLKSFFAKYPNIPKYFFSHVLTAHIPSQTGLSALDLDITETLKGITLNNTFVWLVADHGISYGPYERGKFGTFDHRNPVSFLIAPRNYLSEEMEANLLYNQHQLMTFYDIHMTIKDIATMGMKVKPERKKKWNTKNSDPEYGQSLFTKISSNRSCKDTGIAPQWCACHQDVTVRQETDPALAKTFLQLTFATMMEEVRQDGELCVNLTDYKDAFEVVGEKGEKNQFLRTMELAFRKTAMIQLNIQAIKEKWIHQDLLDDLKFSVLLTPVQSSSRFSAQKWDVSVTRTSKYSPELCHHDLKPVSRVEFCVCKKGNQFNVNT